MESEDIDALSMSFFTILYSIYDKPFLETFNKDSRKSRKKRRLARRISGFFYDETEELADYITNQWKKEVNPPVLDGLFGGKACYRSWADTSKSPPSKIFQD